MPYPGSFNKDELLEIALLWGKYDDIENETARIDNVRWEFIKFNGLQKKPKPLPPRQRIKTVVDRFLETGSVLLKTPPKVRVKAARTDENVARVEELIRADKSLSITAVAITLFLSWATVWRILRIDLKFYPYKSKCVNRLTDDHKRKDDVRRATTHCRLRAQICAENGGSHFKHQLKKRRNMPVEE